MNKEKNKKLSKLFSVTRGGVKVKHNKNTCESQSLVMTVPNEVHIPMKMHIGAECTPLVKKGDKVKVGTKIGDSESFLSSPIFSSVSGEVKEIGKTYIASGQKVKYVNITCDKLQEEESFSPPQITDKASFISAVKASGLVGLGGAGFPMHIKLNTDKQIDTLIINAAECEPYITSDCREISESTSDIIDGIEQVTKWIGIPKTVIVVEDNKPKEIRLLHNEIKRLDLEKKMSVLTVKSLYPRGAEKVIIYLATGRRMGAGELPADHGVIVMNVSSVAFLSKYLKTGHPLTNRRVTVEGTALKNHMNIIAPIGTMAKDLAEFTGGYKEPPKKIIMGGPMMGSAILNDEFAVTKTTNALIFCSHDQAKTSDIYHCINCGKCIDACPMGLMPVNIYRHVKLEDAKLLKEDFVTYCMECGSCAYCCPAKRPLVQIMKRAKQIVKNEETKK